MTQPGEIVSFDIFDFNDPRGSARSTFKSQPFEILLEGIDVAQVQNQSILLKQFLLGKDVKVKGPYPSKRGVKEFTLKSRTSQVGYDVVLNNVIVHKRILLINSVTKKQILSLIQFPSCCGVNISIKVEV